MNKKHLVVWLALLGVSAVAYAAPGAVETEGPTWQMWAIGGAGVIMTLLAAFFSGYQRALSERLGRLETAQSAVAEKITALELQIAGEYHDKTETQQLIVRAIEPLSVRLEMNTQAVNKVHSRLDGMRLVASKHSEE